MPTTVYDNMTVKQLVEKINGGDNMAPHDKISIKASTIFNRGDEETGVWKNDMKVDYIDSIMSGYPCGQICLVRDYGNAMNNYSAPSMILDGANKCRAIRDFLANKFKFVQGKTKVLFKDLTIIEQQKLLNTKLATCKTEITREDSVNSITEMFTRLNTKQVGLSHGELLKAFCWRKIYVIPELAKHIIGGPKWAPHLTSGLHEDESYPIHQEIIENNDKIIELQQKWAASPMGNLCETNRLDSVALVCGMMISSVEKNIKFFDKKFKVLESKLPLEITSDQVSNILDDLLQFVNIITSLACCFDGELKKNAIFGKVNMGLPSASRIVYLFTIIINNDGKSDEDQLKLVDNWKSYFIWLSTDANSRENFIAICRTGGDNHASGRKFDRIQAAVSNFALNSMDSDE